MTTTAIPPVRYERATRALLDAYARDDLAPDDPTRDAVGTLIFASTGTRDGSWWKSLLAYRFDRADEQDQLVLDQLRETTGYTPAELSAVEDAFEDAGPLHLRVAAVLDVLSQREHHA